MSASGWLSRLCSKAYPDDPQAVVTLVSTVVLLASLVAIVAAVVRRIWVFGDLGSGSCWALGVAVAGLCILAHVQAPALPGLPGAVEDPDA